MMTCSFKNHRGYREVVGVQAAPRFGLDDGAAASPTRVSARDSGEALDWLELCWTANVLNDSVCSLQ